MIKFVIHTIINLVILGIGFGLGVHFSTQHPQAAQSLNAAEERDFLQAQATIIQGTEAKLDQLSNNKNGATADEIAQLKQQQQQALQNLQNKISSIGAN